MFSILNRALSWAITSFGNKFCLKKRSRLIEVLDHRFYVKFMQLEIGLLLISTTFCLSSPFWLVQRFSNTKKISKNATRTLLTGSCNLIG